METLEELKSELREIGCLETIVLENPDYATAAIGTDEEDRVVYDYDMMIEHLVEHEGMTYEDACDFLNSNTLANIPNMGEKRPVVLTRFHEYKLSL